MSLIKIALLFTLLTCGNDFLPFLMSKSTASAFSFRKNVPILVPESFTRFLFSSEANPEINSQEKWLDYVRSNPIARLFGLHNDLKEAGVDFREFDLAQYEPELHHGTGPVVINSADVPVVSRTRRSAPLSEEEWLAKAKAQYEARDGGDRVGRQLVEAAKDIHDQVVDQFIDQVLRNPAYKPQDIGIDELLENTEGADDVSSEEASTDVASVIKRLAKDANDSGKKLYAVRGQNITFGNVFQEDGSTEPDHIIKTKVRLEYIKPVRVQKSPVRLSCKGIFCHLFSQYP